VDFQLGNAGIMPLLRIKKQEPAAPTTTSESMARPMPVGGLNPMVQLSDFPGNTGRRLIRPLPLRTSISHVKSRRSMVAVKGPSFTALVVDTSKASRGVCPWTFDFTSTRSACMCTRPTVLPTGMEAFGNSYRGHVHPLSIAQKCSFEQ
jgi:hypothetical protein